MYITAKIITYACTIVANLSVMFCARGERKKITYVPVNFFCKCMSVILNGNKTIPRAISARSEYLHKGFYKLCTYRPAGASTVVTLNPLTLAWQ